MIDEKKIQEAAIMNADYFNPCRSTLDREEACRASFEDGVEWFKKALWHDASEMPEKGKAFIFLAESNSSKHYHVGVVYNPMDYDKNCKWWGVIEWCYIEDLLPKGGEK
jgi:hypothetical protein|nr:MAG TPA: hypothetical protein [Caudoviricetes sp.]DAO53089.1 MAG TPA: hypothetical protein [Caudoviricetes sp.]